MGKDASQYPTTRVSETFLPDFCQPKATVAALVIVELLAIMLTIPALDTPMYWNKLLFASIYIQWITLISLILFCILRSKSKGLDQKQTALISYLIILVVTLLVAEIAYWITRNADPALFPFQFQHSEILFISFVVSAITGLVALRYFYLRYETEKTMEAEAHAQLIALQARIKPHFLFNCMNTILGLMRAEPRLAEKMLENLAELMRTGLSNVNMLVQFSEETMLTNRYIEMEQLRFSERLQVKCDFDEIPGNALVPSLSLQPLIENAIYHGIEPLPDGGIIDITGRFKDNKIHIKIVNPVPDQSQIKFKRKGHRIAMDNVTQRLTKHFGKKATLTSFKKDNKYTVNLCIPFFSKEDIGHENINR